MLSLRRIIGIIIGAIPFVIVLLCTLYKVRGAGNSIALGYSLFALGGIVGIINFYLHVLRYPIHCFRHGKDAKYQWVSGIPLLGISSVIGLTLLPWSVWLSIFAFLFLCMDVGGIQWFVVFTWKDDSLWNPKKYDKEKMIKNNKEQSNCNEESEKV